jgi:hypothetical protein
MNAESGNPLRDELARFNEERRKLLGGVPPHPDGRMPIERSGVGGDVEEER